MLDGDSLELTSLVYCKNIRMARGTDRFASCAPWCALPIRPCRDPLERHDGEAALPTPVSHMSHDVAMITP